MQWLLFDPNTRRSGINEANFSPPSLWVLCRPVLHALAEVRQAVRNPCLPWRTAMNDHLHPLFREILQVTIPHGADRMSCKPNDGTKPGTFHVLRDRDSGKQEMFEWTGSSWSTPGTGWGTKWSLMDALGWRYVGPAPAAARATNGEKR